VLNSRTADIGLMFGVFGFNGVAVAMLRSPALTVADPLVK